MNIDFSAEELAFRAEVKAWFEANLPKVKPLYERAPKPPQRFEPPKKA